MLPAFIVGVIVFVFILLMFQVLRLTEFIIVHGDTRTALEIVFYLTISFLPAILPMSLLFAVLLTFSRLSSDSEIVAFKAAGLHLGYLAVPPLVLGIIVAAFSAHTSFYLAPWGNRQFEVLITKRGSTKAASAIREGTFSEGFFDMVMYAQNVDTKNNKLTNVFIYDERDASNPITIIAKTGQVASTGNEQKVGALLRLSQGHIHRTNDDSYTKINFESYDLNLFRPITEVNAEKSILSFTLPDLKAQMADPKVPEDKRKVYLNEYHKRWAISAACILFALVGVGLGAVTHKRTVRSGSLIISLGVIIAYWGLYVTGDSVARQGLLPAWLAIWNANILFTFVGAYFLKRNWN